MDAAHGSSHQQLGEILLAAGLLTEPQLAQALDEQKRTGKRLGEIVVERGFLSRGAIANALAEQHGSLLKTEYGFGTGLGNRLRERASTPAPAPAANGATEAPKTDDPDDLIGKLRSDLEEREAHLATVEAAAAKQREGSDAEAQAQLKRRDELIEELQRAVQRQEGEIAHLRLECERRDAAAEELRKGLEQRGAAVEELEGKTDAADQLRLELEKRDAVIGQLEAKIQALEAELVQGREAVEELKNKLEADEAEATGKTDATDQLRRELEKRDAVVGQLRAKIQALEAEPAPLKEATPAPSGSGTTGDVRIWTEEKARAPVPATPQSSHLLRVPTPNGFLLVERNGPAPQVGTEVQVPGDPEGRFVVSKLVRGPLQGRYWVYLEPAEPPRKPAAADG